MDIPTIAQSEESNPRAPRISVVIATRDRGTAIRDTLMSVRASTLQDWEVIVVDQSMSGETEAIVRSIAEHDSRVHYLRSSSTGASRARNVALREVRAPFVAITDDDCEVAPDWLARIIEAFEAEPAVGFICGTLAPAPFDPHKGHIPHSCPSTRRIVVRPWPLIECYAANAAVRRSVLDQVGLFDELLGPGAIFSCTEDQDSCHRVLLAGHHVLIDPEVHVIHHGFRTNAEMPPIWERDARGIGGMLAKELRCGAPQAVLELAGFWIHWLRIVVGHTVSFRRPLKFRQSRSYVLYSALAFFEGLRHPISRGQRVYIPQSWQAADAMTLNLQQRQFEQAGVPNGGS
jgi:glycosyltransferase involved in cell wall biosynthesis